MFKVITKYKNDGDDCERVDDWDADSASTAEEWTRAMLPKYAQVVSMEVYRVR